MAVVSWPAANQRADAATRCSWPSVLVTRLQCACVGGCHRIALITAHTGNILLCCLPTQAPSIKPLLLSRLELALLCSSPCAAAR